MQLKQIFVNKLNFAYNFGKGGNIFSASFVFQHSTLDFTHLKTFCSFTLIKKSSFFVDIPQHKKSNRQQNEPTSQTEKQMREKKMLHNSVHIDR